MWHINSSITIKKKADLETICKILGVKDVEIRRKYLLVAKKRIKDNQRVKKIRKETPPS